MRFGKKWRLFDKSILGPVENPYMIRWRIFECPWFRVFLHKICRSDDDRHLHCHPFSFFSFLMRGAYTEWRNSTEQDDTIMSIVGIKYHAPWILYRNAAFFHRLQLNEIDGPAWTLVFAGPRVRDWGFQTEDGWVSHERYLVEP